MQDAVVMLIRLDLNSDDFTKIWIKLPLNPDNMDLISLMILTCKAKLKWANFVTPVEKCQKVLRWGWGKDETEYLQSSIPIWMGQVCPQHSNLQKQKPALYKETEETHDKSKIKTNKIKSKYSLNRHWQVFLYKHVCKIQFFELAIQLVK